MDHFAGLDVSVKETSVCILDDASKDIPGAGERMMYWRRRCAQPRPRHSIRSRKGQPSAIRGGDDSQRRLCAVGLALLAISFPSVRSRWATTCAKQRTERRLVL
jgi:hypothetical protein